MASAGESVVFVSHASNDKEFAAKLCDDMGQYDIETWASFKDIEPGTEWDKAIQDALDAAKFVLVIVSQASIESSYVRSEIEYALDNKKVVIPVLIEQVKLPLRWHTLQYIDLSKDRESSLKMLADKLPKGSVATLKRFLQEAQEFQAFQKLMWNNPQWIRYDAISRKHFGVLEALANKRAIPQLNEDLDKLSHHLLDDRFTEYKEVLLHEFPADTNEKLARTAFNILYFDLLESAKTADYFAFNPITFGTNVEIIYLCSPYAPLFQEQDDLELFHNHLANAEAFMADFADKLTLLSDYNVFQYIDAIVLSGQRHQYTKPLIDKRQKMSVPLGEFPSGKNVILGRLQIVSYDRFLDKVITRSAS